MKDIITAHSNPSANVNLAERSRLVVWHPCTQMQVLLKEPVEPISQAEGPWLFGFNGERWFDGISSWWTCLLGHRHPKIIQALHQQLDTLDHIMLAGFTHQPAVDLAERLVTLTGRALNHVSFASDGASALEIALKQSAQAWRNQGLASKTHFVCLSGSYHGETLGALGVTDQALFSEHYRSLLRTAFVVTGPDDRRALKAGISPQEESARALERLETLFKDQAERISAFVCEPLIQGAGGMVMYHPEFLRGVRSLCDTYSIHWIADEIATGCGRTGRFFAVEHAGVWPDLLCLSKGITGGVLPLSLVLSSSTIFDAFWDESIERAFLHSHSFTGNPLACRAAVAMLDVLDKEAVLTQNKHRGDQIELALSPLLSCSQVKDMRRLGMIFAFDCLGGPPQAKRIQVEAKQRGLLIRPIGATVYLMPPFLMTDQECIWLGETLCKSVLAQAT
jgi:adenosylmethionine-8-amino-7-oxononanoate aminotransferase